jgi:uncharacterized paraquat-inducible protein A
MKTNRRLRREKETISKMIVLFCRQTHAPENTVLCQDCLELEAYAHQRIQHCPYGASKPTCARCTVHCYQPQKREAIRQVMRYAGPRMLLHHPLLTLQHLIDTLRFPPK